MVTFSALLVLCAGKSPVTGEFPSQRPVTRSFDVIFDLRLNKRSSKQMWGWWLETPLWPLWRHCNVSIWYALLALATKYFAFSSSITDSRRWASGTWISMVIIVTPTLNTWRIMTSHVDASTKTESVPSATALPLLKYWIEHSFCQNSNIPQEGRNSARWIVSFGSRISTNISVTENPNSLIISSCQPTYVNRNLFLKYLQKWQQHGRK